MIGITRLLRSQNVRRMDLDTIFRLTTPCFECAYRASPTTIVGIIIMLITLFLLLGTGNGSQEVGELTIPAADLAVAQRISHLEVPTVDDFNASSHIYTKLTNFTTTAQHHLPRSKTLVTNMNATANSTVSNSSNSTFFSGPVICTTESKCISPSSVVLAAAVTTIFFFVVCWNMYHLGRGTTRASWTAEVDMEQGLLEKDHDCDDDEDENFEQPLAFDCSPRDQEMRMDRIAGAFIGHESEESECEFNMATMEGIYGGSGWVYWYQPWSRTGEIAARVKRWWRQ